MVGAGFAGLYALHRLRALGLSIQGFEGAADVGGTWWWNRYPGARCDVEIHRLLVLVLARARAGVGRGSERYATQPEILRYVNHVADRFDLRRDIQFETRVTAATWDEDAQRWDVDTDRGDTVSAQFCVMADGLPVRREAARDRRHRHVRGRDVPHRPLAPRGRRLHRPAGRRDRHRARRAIQSIPIIAAAGRAR